MAGESWGNQFKHPSADDVKWAMQATDAELMDLLASVRHSLPQADQSQGKRDILSGILQHRRSSAILQLTNELLETGKRAERQSKLLIRLTWGLLLLTFVLAVLTGLLWNGERQHDRRPDGFPGVTQPAGGLPSRPSKG